MLVAAFRSSPKAGHLLTCSRQACSACFPRAAAVGGYVFRAAHPRHALRACGHHRQRECVHRSGIGKALVCADLNANQACDAGEPVSPATGADGSYSLTYQPADENSASAFRSAALVATIGADAVDAADPGSTATQRAFVLMAPAGKASRISPLTTLVQKAVAQGQSLADAEAAVAQQLDISVARIYDYQGDTPSSAAVLPDTARTVAK